MFPNKNHTLVSFLACVFCSLTLCGQVIKSDVAAINTAYQKLDKLSFTFELNMFENYQTPKIYYSQSGLIQKNGKATFQKFDNTECVNTPKYSVVVDKSEKEIVYAPKKRGFDPADPLLAIDLDTLLRVCQSSQFKKFSDKLNGYVFVMGKNYPDYNQIIVQFSPETFLIEKIIFYCEEDDISIDNEKARFAKSRIEIRYKDINTRPALSPQDFSYEKYLFKSGSSFKIKPELKEYHLTVLSF